MKRIHSFLLACGLLCTPAAGTTFTEDDRAEPGYTSLFNGKDLSGWRYGKQTLDGMTETPDKRFQVADGVIAVHEGKGIRDLYTVRDFPKDFHLKLEFRAAPRADSGVYIRGPQLQVRDYPTVGPYKKLKTFRSGGWNELDISVKQVGSAALALCKCNGEVLEKAMPVPARGGIGLQAEVGKFAYRHIRIKELP